MFQGLMPRHSGILFDIGAAGIRACQLSARGSRIALRESLQLGFSLDPEEPEADPQSDVCSRAARIIGQGRFVGCDVGLVLSPPNVFFHALKIPQNMLEQDEARIREALAWEIARETRSEPDQLEVRYWPLPPGNRQGFNVMSAAMPRAASYQWVESFRARRLDLSRIDVSPNALARAVRRTWSPEEADIWGVLDFGHRHTQLTVAVGVTPVYIRSLPVTGRQMTEQISASFDVPYADAERLKCTHGIAPTEGGAREDDEVYPSTDEREVSSILFTVLRKPLAALVREINLCFSYVLQSYHEANVTRLFLVGGGARLRGLTEYLDAYMDLPIGTLDTHAGRGVPPGEIKISAETAAVIGASMCDLEDR